MIQLNASPENGIPVPGQKLKCKNSYPLLYVRAGDVYTVAEVDDSGHEVNLRFEETPEESWYSLCRFRKVD